MTRPNWENYFLGIAKAVAERSHDIHTKHGCVITDRNHRVIGMGYNGFPKGMDDSMLPTTRPEKYDWMIHAEQNALANCVIRPDNGIAYITGQCCNNCIMSLWQNGVTRIVMANSHGTKLFDKEAEKRFNFFVHQTGLEVIKYEQNLSWIKKIEI